MFNMKGLNVDTKFIFQPFQIVSQISAEISDETKTFIREERSEETKENRKLWGDHIVCNYVPYKPARKPLAKLTTKPATASSVVTEFTMKFVKKPVGALVPQIPVVPESRVSCFNIMVIVSLRLGEMAVIGIVEDRRRDACIQSEKKVDA